MNWKNDTSRTGYNLEELYFERLNRELINRLKTEGKGGKEEASKEHMAEVIPFRAKERGAQEKKAA